jgi:hypothetical protein
LSDRILRCLLPLVSLCLSLLLGLNGAVWAPDAGQYRLLALGQHSAVPPPFSARILGPAMAGWFGRVTGLGVDTGFLALGIASLVIMLAAVAALLWLLEVPTLIFAGIFLMPFWVDIFHDYYLPDPLHGAILAVLLLCLLLGYPAWAFLLLLPAYLARESTSLVALCLVFACWRRIPLRAAAVGAGALVAAAAIGKHFAHGGPGSIHGITGGTYIAGKMLWSFFKNILGLPLWSNTLPECNPVWTRAIPSWLHLGAIHQVGLCTPSSWGPSRLILAWFGLFGIAPALAFAAWKLFPRLSPIRKKLPGQDMVLRFSIIYGLISILMTPILGASVDRLVAYGWPFCFVALPWYLSRVPGLRSRGTWLLLTLHLAACWWAWFCFRHFLFGPLVAVVVLLLNVSALAWLRHSNGLRRSALTTTASS